jgi:hypothetical protein
MLKLPNGKRTKSVMLNGKVGYILSGVGCKECGWTGKRRGSVWLEYIEGSNL